MAMNIMNWNVQQDGDDDNGGGYSQTDPGTDYSLQAAAELSLTDLYSDGSTGLSSDTGGFTAAMVGNLIHIISGTNAVPGWYEIKTYTDTNNVTIDRDCDDGVGALGGGSGGAEDGVGKVGGALATVGGLGAALASNAAVRIVGSRGWLKYNATPYALTNTTYNTAGGPFKHDNAWNLPFAVLGYQATFGDVPTSRPTIDTGANNPATGVFYSDESSVSNALAVANMIIDGNSGTSAYGIVFGSQSVGHAYNIKIVDCDCGVLRGTCVACESLGGTAQGFYLANHCYKCSTTNATGYANCLSVSNCIAYECSGIGFSECIVCERCVAVNCTGDGFDTSSSTGGIYINCVSALNAYGFDTTGNIFVWLLGCYTYSNSSGSHGVALINFLSPPTGLDNITELSADPFVSSAIADDDYWLNNNNPGGAELRGAGIKLPLTGVVDEPDIAATQHQDSGGGDTPSVPHFGGLVQRRV